MYQTLSFILWHNLFKNGGLGLVMQDQVDACT